ncbi:MAG: hypothetical protein ACXQTS_06010 [Candidatus Methanospirareceae archaeon]
MGDQDFVEVIKEKLYEDFEFLHLEFLDVGDNLLVRKDILSKEEKELLEKLDEKIVNYSPTSR